MKIHIFPGKYHQNGGFSMAMLVYRRVTVFFSHRSTWYAPRNFNCHLPAQAVILNISARWVKWVKNNKSCMAVRAGPFPSPFVIPGLASKYRQSGAPRCREGDTLLAEMMNISLEIYRNWLGFWYLRKKLKWQDVLWMDQLLHVWIALRARCITRLQPHDSQIGNLIWLELFKHNIAMVSP